MYSVSTRVSTGAFVDTTSGAGRVAGPRGRVRRLLVLLDEALVELLHAGQHLLEQRRLRQDRGPAAEVW